MLVLHCAGSVRALAEGVYALQDNWKKLEEWTRSRWTQAGEVRFKWSGQV